jgi:hypothetical protein
MIRECVESNVVEVELQEFKLWLMSVELREDIYNFEGRTFLTPKYS